jgi:nucleotide-binding universal stress UspA family protein
MKSVLVPLDGTKSAEGAISLIDQVLGVGDTVVLLAVKKHEDPDRTGAMPGGLIRGGFAGPSGPVMGVVRPDTSVFQETKDQAYQRQANEAYDYLEHLAVGLRTAGYLVKTEVIFSNAPAQVIIDYAREMKPTFIALLRRTHFGLNALLFGSTATQIIEANVAPMLFVPTEP